jgi:hypothetical protein
MSQVQPVTCVSGLDSRILAETEGFEPSIPFSRYAHLANECLQPLGHISSSHGYARRGGLPQAAFSGKAAVWRRAAILALPTIPNA